MIAFLTLDVDRVSAEYRGERDRYEDGPSRRSQSPTAAAPAEEVKEEREERNDRDGDRNDRGGDRGRYVLSGFSTSFPIKICLYGFLMCGSYS
jgi:hypothetical protein